MSIECVNCPSGIKKKYKLTAPSPNGLGYSATYEPTGKIMTGKDGMPWVVTTTRGGKSRRWVEVDKESASARRSRGRSNSKSTSKSAPRSHYASASKSTSKSVASPRKNSSHSTGKSAVRPRKRVSNKKLTSRSDGVYNRILRQNDGMYNGEHYSNYNDYRDNYYDENAEDGMYDGSYKYVTQAKPKKRQYRKKTGSQSSKPLSRTPLKKSSTSRSKTASRKKPRATSRSLSTKPKPRGKRNRSRTNRKK